MAIKTWILAGVSINDSILSTEESCWRRPDLVNVPDILKYTKEVDEKTEIQIYENNIGVVVTLIPYSEFPSRKKMEEDYRNESEDSQYFKVYKDAIALINAKYSCKHFIDFDWVMPIIEGNLDIQANYCTISKVGEDNKQYVGLIDCSMIYTSVRQISDFVHYICNRKRLTKYQRWQLAYYQMSIQSIESPKVFLTNKEEISIYNELYSTWQIDENIRSVINNTNQMVSLFSFLSKYDENEGSGLFSSFLTFFGIVVGLEAIYNLFAALFDDEKGVFRIIFVSLIAISVVGFSVIFIQKLVRRHIERTEFSKKTKSK